MLMFKSTADKRIAEKERLAISYKEQRDEHARVGAERARSVKALTSKLNDLEDEKKRLIAAVDAEKAKRVGMKARLDTIAACETPSANGTVRRMARIARGEATLDPTPTVPADQLIPMDSSHKSPEDFKKTLQAVLDNPRLLISAFTWDDTPQPTGYWSAVYTTVTERGEPLPDEARRIIEASIAALEADVVEVAE